MSMGPKSCEPIKVLLLLVCAVCAPLPAEMRNPLRSCQVQVARLRKGGVTGLSQRARALFSLTELPLEQIIRQRHHR